MRWILFLFTCFLVIKAHPQERDNRVRLETGFTVRTTIFYLMGLRGQQSGPLINATAPYSYKKGVTGTGATVGFNFLLTTKTGIRFVESTTIRYDFYKYREPNDYINTFYFDQSLLLTKRILRTSYAGIGYTWYNLGKDLHYTYDNEDLTLALHFNAIDLVLGFPIWKIHLEPKLSIVSENFPGSVKDNATLFAVRLHYSWAL